MKPPIIIIAAVGARRGHIERDLEARLPAALVLTADSIADLARLSMASPPEVLIVDDSFAATAVDGVDPFGALPAARVLVASPRVLQRRRSPATSADSVTTVAHPVEEGASVSALVDAVCAALPAGGLRIPSEAGYDRHDVLNSIANLVLCLRSLGDDITRKGSDEQEIRALADQYEVRLRRITAGIRAAVLPRQDR